MAGTTKPKTPRAAIRSISAAGKVLLCSSSRATGRTSRSTNVATVATYCCSSSVSRDMHPVSAKPTPLVGGGWGGGRVTATPAGRVAPATGAARPVGGRGGAAGRAAPPTGAARPVGGQRVAPALGPGAPPLRHAAGGSSDVVVALARDAGQESPHLALAVATVATEGADRGQLPGLRPTGDGLGVDAKHRRDLSGSEQRLRVGRTSAHGGISLSVAATPVAAVVPWCAFPCLVRYG